MAPARTSANMIPGFTQTAPSIYEHVPATTYTTSYTTIRKPDSPSLILLCTWTGAQCRYIAKYTEEYQRRFPATRIMVIATTAKDLCFRNSKRKQNRLRRAVEEILSLEYLNVSGSPTNILMHIFSEGGSNKACELAEAYHTTTGRRLPVSAICLDSTPGHPRFRRLCDALGKSLPQIPILRHMSLLIGSALLGAVWLVYTIFIGFENNVVTKSRERLLDPKYFDLTAPRCYMYSDKDALISWEDVREHAEDTMECGVPVNDVLFSGSGHVGHARQDPERYWNAVMATWQAARAFQERSRFAMLMEGIKSNEKKAWSDAGLISTSVVVTEVRSEN